ncbi:D-alanyl-D-alanine carboxypeptidase family protein [Paracoccus pacificus]|uniref:serine-type D-Ala-D-Ala carboxypeptidase n=1 Tax=Paracoccus pacificus TaxID=1463598 RepID=A0ABW4RBR9_9RHOB
MTDARMPIVSRIFIAIALFLSFATAARAFDTQAREAWVYDVSTRTVMMEKNADQPMPPASMSKLMTIYMLFEALKEGRVNMDTRLPVSTKARQMAGSTMFLNEKDRPTVEELIQGIIVLSGNDACVVVAEGLSGSEEAFAAQMTERAKGLGLTNSQFKNASGWPAPGHSMTAHDLGVLALRLIEDYPELYKNFAVKEFRYDNRAPANRFNRNPLLKQNIGADGLKTGHTIEAGYGLVGSAVQDGRRVIFVISGLPSDKARAEEAERIVNWAFRQFSMKTLVPKGQTVASAPVWLGVKSSVPLTTADGVRVLIPAAAESGITAEAVYDSPIPAPIKAGDKLGDLVLNVPGTGESSIPLIAAEDVSEAGFVGRMKSAAIRLGTKAWTAVGS